jgi:DNA-binding SARP family transcriptional activator
MLRLNTFGGLVLPQDGQLHTLLWPDVDPESSRHSPYQALHAIRRAVGSDEVFQGGSTLQLNPELITSDVGEFEDAVERRAHEAAARLYGRPFLDGFRLEGAPSQRLANGAEAPVT